MSPVRSSRQSYRFNANSNNDRKPSFRHFAGNSNGNIPSSANRGQQQEQQQGNQGPHKLPPLHCASLDGKPSSIPLHVLLNPLRLGGKPFFNSSSISPLPPLPPAANNGNNDSNRDLRLTKAPIVNENDANMDMQVDHPTIEMEASYFQRNNIATRNKSLTITEEINESTMDTSIEIEHNSSHSNTSSDSIESLGFGSISILSRGGRRTTRIGKCGFTSSDYSDTSSTCSSSSNSSCGGGSSLSSPIARVGRKSRQNAKHGVGMGFGSRIFGSSSSFSTSKPSSSKCTSTNKIKFTTRVTKPATPEKVRKLRMRRQRQLARSAFDFAQLAV